MTGRLIFSRSIGKRENGRRLSLSETNDLVCPIQHNITYFHDPVIDIVLTKCLFNYIVDSIGYDDILFEEPEEIW
ncbi:Hypothetical protein CINCED_3A018565 [Cinara cedri]|uniref:Uncharacterized protein n=1 Tax=Cinara cedri TaxID=506608 RepID=A0A5E4MCH8_9HEMI|nr:Hypothetical protein CINCED_3A018565 [Cinara cedri]